MGKYLNNFVILHILFIEKDIIKNTPTIFISFSKTAMLHFQTWMYSQTCVKRQSSGPENDDHCRQVVVVQRHFYAMKMKSGRCKQMVAIKKWSLA
jgi:hypothetical protein